MQLPSYCNNGGILHAFKTPLAKTPLCALLILFALLGAPWKLKPFSLSLGFLGFAGGGEWFGGGGADHDDEEGGQLFLHCSCACITFVLLCSCLRCPCFCNVICLALQLFGNANFVCIVWRPWETEALQLKLRSLSLRGRWGDIWGRADHDHGQFGFSVSHQVLDVRL